MFKLYEDFPNDFKVQGYMKAFGQSSRCAQMRKHNRAKYFKKHHR